MKPWRQILATYVALCVAFAGAVGLSPVLHHWVEHGGQGPVHVHARSSAGLEQARLSHAHPHTHSHDHKHDHEADRRPHASQAFAEFPSAARATFATAHSSFKASFARMAAAWHELTHCFDHRTTEHAEDSPDPAHPDHHHQSLAQLLADGSVEAALDVPRLVQPRISVLFLGFALQIRPHAIPWDAQTAGRAPPRRST
jgi:hypothetical protein